MATQELVIDGLDRGIALAGAAFERIAPKHSNAAVLVAVQRIGAEAKGAQRTLHYDAPACDHAARKHLKPTTPSTSDTIPVPTK